MSLARSSSLRSRGRELEIPASFHPAIEQGVVVLTQATNPGQSREFVKFIQRPEIAAMMRAVGFTAPNKPSR